MPANSHTAHSVVELRNTSKTYPGTTFPAVSDLSFCLAEGEILSILGPSGCGKSTTLRLIAGFEVPDSGEVFLRDSRASGQGCHVPPEKRGVAMVFQDYALFPHLSVAKNIGFGLRNMKSKERAQRVKEVLDIIELSWLADRYPHQISGGQQQRVALGRALAPRPVVILLDEPFSNLDNAMRGQMRREVQAILRRERATAILVTHDQQEALSFADRVAVMNRGKLEQMGTPEEIFHKPATSFVATFVGHASFISGRVDGEEIDTEIGSLAYNGDHLLTEVIVMIRPDDVKLVPDPAGQGTIMSREFHGSRNFYFVELDSGATMRSRQPSGTIYPPRHEGQGLSEKVGGRRGVPPKPAGPDIERPAHIRPRLEPLTPKLITTQNMPESESTIAIDGPGAVGKTTVGRMLSDRIGFLFIDTGVMYRAVTAVAIQRDVDTDDKDAVTGLARSVDIRITGGPGPGSQKVIVDGSDVTASIRSQAVDRRVSAVSSYPGVREAMVDQQRALASREGVVMVGRDIGTVVLPDAKLKIYLTASAEARARRRYAELGDAGSDVSFNSVLQALERRDKTDSERAHSPLKPALDSIIVDTSHLTADQVVDRIMELWRTVN